MLLGTARCGGEIMLTETTRRFGKGLIRRWTLAAALALFAAATLITAAPNAQAQQAPGSVDSVTLTRSDGSITASWNAPAGATKYHVTYNDGTGWRAPVDDHRNIQSTSITFSADNAKTYVVGVRAGNDNAQWSGWVNSPAAGPYTPPSNNPPSNNPPATAPGPVSSITLTRADGSVTADWDAPSGATKYHVTYNDGTGWHAPVDDHRNVPTNSLTFNADNAKTYVVGVRAGNDVGWSAWRNSPSAGPYTPPTPEPTPAPTPEPTPEITPPAAPTGLTATAGNGSVTLSWNDPSDSSITGYEYNVNHNDTSSGNLSGWSAWTAIAGSNSSTTSHTFTGLTNGKEYRYHLRAVNAGGSSVGAPNAAPWFASATPIGYDENLAVDNVFVETGNGYLDISWSAAPGATHYDIRAKEANANSWHAVAYKVTGTIYRYTTDKTIDYVAVRALSAASVGPWVELSRMPADDFMNVATGISVPAGVASASASIQSGGSIQAKLAAPTGFTVMRYETRITEIDLNWSDVSGATGYNIICSPGQSGWAWHACGWKNSGTVTYTSVPSAQTRPVTATHYERKAGESSHVPGKYRMTYQRAYRMAVRAVNANPDDASDWTNSPVIYPIFATLRDFTYTRSEGSITMSWTPNYWTTGYEFDCAVYDPTQTPYVPSYTRCATLSNQDDTEDTHTVTISSWAAGGTNYSIDDTKQYDIRICSTNATGRGCTLAPWIYPNPSLTASGVTGTTATLAINHHSAAWWYKANTGPDATCQSVSAGTSSDSLTGLTAGTVYVYTAYSKSGCNDADLIATTTFGTTQLVSVSNLDKADGPAAFNLSSDYAQEFTTGSAAGGYTLKSVTLDFTIITNASQIEASIRAVQSNGTPATTARATLTGTPAAGEVTFTCDATNTNNDCSLAANTSYFVYVDALSFATNQQTTTASDIETLQPSGNGWSIANATRYQADSWNEHPQSLAMKMSVSATGAAASASLTATATTLTIGNYTGSWHYQANTGPHATCQGPVTGTSQTISGLTGGASYTYKAYADSACTTANLLATAAAFTAPYSAPGAPTGLGRSGWDLSWTAPSDTGNGSGGITRYEVQCRRALNTTTTNTLTGNPPATYATLTHQHCRNYSTHGNFARVRAFNNIWGAYSGWFRLQ